MLLSVLLLALGPTASAAGELFEMHSIASSGRTVAAEFADLDGDGRTDLLQIAFVGVPPKEERVVRAYLQGAEGRIPATPSVTVPLPAGVAAYDLADVAETPGHELVLLHQRGVSLLALGTPGGHRELALPDTPTVAGAEDERGLDRVRMHWEEFAGQRWLLVPCLGETVLLGAGGEVHARLETGARANYFVPPRPGPLVTESDIQLFLDVPRLTVGDVDGDERGDIVAATRHHVRVFLRRADGDPQAPFARAPDRTYVLTRVSEKDHIRGTGQVRIDTGDFNGDGLLDLLVSQVSGAILDAESDTTVHLNRGGSWNLDAPDQTFAEAGWGSDQIIDLDHDGRSDLVRARMPVSVLELIELLVTRAVDINLSIHRGDPEVGIRPEAWMTRKLNMPVSFETGRPPGFLPTLVADVNADRFRDYLTSGQGDRLDVHLGRETQPFGRRDGSQTIDTTGRIRFGDLDGDGFLDVLLYSPRQPNAPLRFGRNRKTLPWVLSTPAVRAVAPR